MSRGTMKQTRLLVKGGMRHVIGGVRSGGGHRHYYWDAIVRNLACPVVKILSLRPTVQTCPKTDRHTAGRNPILIVVVLHRQPESPLLEIAQAGGALCPRLGFSQGR